jgi:hypothetical protein
VRFVDWLLTPPSTPKARLESSQAEIILFKDGA